MGSRTDDLSQLSVLTTPNSEVLDTAKICGKVLGLLQENKIPVAQFALHALKRSQGRASEILNKPKAYEKFSEEGREPYKKIKKWLDQKDPIADIRGKMQGKNIFVTLQELFIVTQVISGNSSSQYLLHPVHSHDISNTTFATDFIFRYFFSSFKYFDLFA